MKTESITMKTKLETGNVRQSQRIFSFLFFVELPGKS